MVVGDWNTKVPEMDANWGRGSVHGLMRIEPRGGSDTFYRAGQDKALYTSALDHVLVPGVRRPEVRQVRVDRWFDDSDHWPLRVWLQSDRAGAPGQAAPPEAAEKRPSVDRDKLKAARVELVDHARWTAPEGIMDVNELAVKFITAAEVVTRPFVKARRGNARRGDGEPFVLNRAAVAACAERRRALWAWIDVNGATEALRLQRWQRYKEAQKAATAALRECHRQTRMRSVTAAAGMMRRAEGSATRNWWRWSRAYCNGRGRGPDSCRRFG